MHKGHEHALHPITYMLMHMLNKQVNIKLLKHVTIKYKYKIFSHTLADNR